MSNWMTAEEFYALTATMRSVRMQTRRDERGIAMYRLV